MMMAALTSSVNENTSRFIWLYDTFSGMPEPGDKDVNYRGDVAMNQWLAGRKDGYNQWCYANLESVRMNMASTCYPEKKIRFVKGMVGQTIPAEIPDKIALLRLDTDWYASTKHELENLYPLLCEGGVLIIDDYGHWEGCRQAVDEFFRKNDIPLPLFNRIDRLGIMAVKSELA